MASASEIPEAILAVLPEDAPLDHVSYKKVKVSKNTSRPPHAAFKVRQPDGTSVPFQTTLSSLGSNGSDYALERIARACYVLLEAGSSKEDVNQFRADCYDKVKAVSGQGTAAAIAQPAPLVKLERKPEAKKSEAKPDTEKSEKLTVKSEEKLAVKSEEKLEVKSDSIPDGQAAAVGAEAKASALIDAPDAPEGHEAWQKLKLKGPGNYQFHFKKSKGERIPFQVTTKAANESNEEAQRIARLCYLKFEQGDPKEVVLQYRDELYRKACDGAPPHASGYKRGQDTATAPAGSRKRARRVAVDAVDVADKLVAEGRGDGALLIDGRKSDRKNSSINGVYALLPHQFGGSPAYEKFLAGDAPRFLFFSEQKHRWKISTELEDDKGGCAFCKTQGGGKSPPVTMAGSTWKVYDGKGEGYVSDPAVRCLRLSDQAQGPAAVNGSSRKLADEASLSETDSDSESSSSGGSKSSSSEGAPEDRDGGAMPAVTQVLPRPRSQGLVCAKMLVRSGLRCACHFSNVQGCPERLKALQELS
ncbi:unnamed protein product [Polarella glacialis]|uniref:Uncharacterized protein n=1 Tax=Polarella glacialis TaxID=89957 RepID=A0A813GIF2_POLGL|nr:unnamed protein product [Polarella glacialis]